MKKQISTCADCGEDNSILTQVSSGPDVIHICIDCYILNKSKEINNEISYAQEEKS